MLTLILGVLLGLALMATICVMGGQLIQQRRQVVELRQTNVTLYQENQHLKLACANGNLAYDNLKKQVEKIQEGPIAAALSHEQIDHIASLTAAKVDALLDKPSLVN
jgi:Tfp pilus assembly protein PilN